MTTTNLAELRGRVDTLTGVARAAREGVLDAAQRLDVTSAIFANLLDAAIDDARALAVAEYQLADAEARSERTRAGLAARKATGKPVGRQPGTTDKSPRDTAGYRARWARERGEDQDQDTGLNAAAVAVLAAAGVTPDDWARRHLYQAGAWGGDACGCPDDRCAGHHHDARQRCGCLDVLLDQYLAGEPYPTRFP